MPALNFKAEFAIVTVCSACLRACCWQGHFMCGYFLNSGTTVKTIATLKALNLEHPSYWETEG